MSIRLSCVEELVTGLAMGLVGAVTLNLASGCAAARDWRQVNSPSEYAFRQVCGNVTLVVEPWLDGDDQHEAFGTKLTSKRILPLRVILYNDSSTVIRFSSTQASLVFPGGQTLRTMPKSQVVDMIEESESVAPVIIMIATLGYGQLAAKVVSKAIEDDNWKDQRAVRSASMELVRLDPGQALSGFLFFHADKLLRRNLRSETHRLCVSRITRADATPLSFELEFTLSEKENQDAEGVGM